MWKCPICECINNDDDDMCDECGYIIDVEDDYALDLLQ